MTIQEIKNLIESTKGIIIEIAGPTPQGYSFLDKNNIALSHTPIITNTSKVVESWNSLDDTFSTVTVDEVVDVRNLPYANNSISLILVSNLIISPYEIDVANALPEYDNPLLPTNNLHLFLYKEAVRVLRSKGLLVQVSPLPKDISAAKIYGLENMYFSAEDKTAIFQKQ